MKKLWVILKKTVVAVFFVLPIILIFVVLSARMAGNIPSLFGYSFSVVVTPSMSDVLPVGSIILSRDYGGEELTAGQIITYAGESGSFAGKLVTHKIESVTADEATGETVIVTKGTQNTVADPAIRPDMVRSVLICKLINLGGLFEVIKKPTGFLLICILPLLAVIAYELYDFTRSLRKEEKSDEKEK